MDQQAEVTEFLRNLVRCGHHPRDHAQPEIEYECAADRQATDEVVQAIGDQDQVAHGMAVMDSPVTVVPVQELLEYEERNKTQGDQAVDGHIVAERVDRLRQHVEQRAAK